jgi:SAM-dependent methyltransferase
MISDTGAWNITGSKFEESHAYDERLSDSLINYAKTLNIKKSYDFGCGGGKYVENFRKHGIEAFGIDGNPITSSFPFCSVQDLTSKFQLEPVNFLLCLEVCEHVPKEYEDILLDTLDRHLLPGGTLVISWAIVGQSGLGHVNCQNNDYVLNKFNSLGFNYDESASLTLRKNVKLSWFSNTILVFNKEVK